jgi:hypothetical protein
LPVKAGVTHRRIAYRGIAYRGIAYRGVALNRRKDDIFRAAPRSKPQQCRRPQNEREAAPCRRTLLAH